MNSNSNSNDGGVSVVAPYVRGTRTTRATVLGDDRCRVRTAVRGTSLVDAIEVRSRAMACEAPEDVSDAAGGRVGRFLGAGGRVGRFLGDAALRSRGGDDGARDDRGGGFRFCSRAGAPQRTPRRRYVAPVEATAELRGVTARDGEDFLSSGLGPNVGRPTATATVRWEAGARAGAVREVVVPIVDDAAHEGEEMEFFEIVLVSATNAATASAPMDASSVIFIRDDDALPAFEFVANVPAHRPRPVTYDGADAGGMFPRESVGYAEQTTNATAYFDAAAKEEEEATRHRERHRDKKASAHTSVEAIVRRVSGVASAPSVLRYETVTFSEDASDASYARVVGEIHWDTSEEDASSTAERRVSIPVDWSVVPDHAEIAVGMRLTAVANARAPVNEPAEAAAVWIYGVERGSCARGFRRDEPAPARDAQLSAMVVRARDDEDDERRGILELVPAFHPTRRSYAVATRNASTSETGVGTRRSSSRFRRSTLARRSRFRRRGRARRRRRASGRNPRPASSSSGSRAAAKRRA